MESIDSLVDIINQYPKFAEIAMLMGALRVVFKPIFTFVDKYVQSTPALSDNEKWNTVKTSKYFRLFAFFLDYFASVKVIKKDQVKA